MHGRTVMLMTQNEDLSGLDQKDDVFSTDCAVQMHTCGSEDEVNIMMENIATYNIDPENYNVYSGAIFSAKEMPTNLKGLTPYLIINANEESIYDDMLEGVFKELPKDIDAICDTITKVLSTKIRIELDTGFVYDGYPTIDNVYLFIGKQMELALTVSADSMDEELIDRLDSICDDVLDGKAIVINEDHMQNDGDSSIMKDNIVLTVNHSEAVGEGKDAVYKITGRLIGMCTSEEALKVVNNKEVSRRVHTKPTAGLSNVVDLIIEQQKANHLCALKDRKLPHVVVAIATIKNMTTYIETKPVSRKLYVTPPIDFMSGNSESATVVAATFECSDGTMCSISEKLKAEV